MAEKTSDPKDVAEVLEALAKSLRESARAASKEKSAGLTVGGGDAEDERPSLGEMDLFTDDRAITVTVETRNTDAASVHVSLLAGRLLIGIGEGPDAFKRDLPLPAAVEEDAAVATFRNGILDVVLPLKK